MRQFIAIAFLFVVLVGLAYGQATMTQTTLGATVDSNSDTVIQVANATGFVARVGSNIQARIRVDNEMMDVMDVSGLFITVRRGWKSEATKHASGAVVYVGPLNYFYDSDPPAGTPCVAADQTVLPRVTIGAGGVFNCTNSLWTPIQLGSATGAGVYVMGTGPTLTSPAITTDLRATTAGAPSIGTAAKPFGSLIVGTAATNVFTFTPAALAAARAITIADPGGAATLAWRNPTSTQTLLTTNIFGDSTAPTKMAAISLSGATATKTATLTFVHTLDRAYTFPDASITIPGTVYTDCATANACSATVKSSTMKVVTGVTAALDAASPSTAAVTGMPAFTGTTTYHCTATLEGNTAASAAKGVVATNISATAVTFYSANGATEKVHYRCTGW